MLVVLTRPVQENFCTQEVKTTEIAITRKQHDNVFLHYFILDEIIFILDEGIRISWKGFRVGSIPKVHTCSRLTFDISTCHMFYVYTTETILISNSVSLGETISVSPYISQTTIQNVKLSYIKNASIRCIFENFWEMEWGDLNQENVIFCETFTKCPKACLH